MSTAPSDLSAALLRWYDVHRRTMPWREDPTPYHVLLSEIMLQQTRVDTVIPYFERFTTRWPTLTDFARADEDEVMTMWAGLGYYRRAKNLLKCAKEAVARGGLSGDVAALRELPGIGAYTAGAIASIAFGTQTPVVDGNVERVLSRLYRNDADPTKTKGKRVFWGLAEPLVPSERPGDFNQALMELGATVCTPKTPKCETCPWAEPCLARTAGDALSFPKKSPKKQPKAVFGVSGILRLRDGILLGRRSGDGLLSGLWEPPSLEVDEKADFESEVVRAFRETVGLEVRPVARLGEVKHVFTHRRLMRTVFEVEVVGVGEPQSSAVYDALAIVDPKRASEQDIALSKLAVKTLALHDRGPLFG